MNIYDNTQFLSPAGSDIKILKFYKKKKMRANVSEMDRHSMPLLMIVKSGETFFFSFMNVSWLSDLLVSLWDSKAQFLNFFKRFSMSWRFRSEFFSFFESKKSQC